MGILTWHLRCVLQICSLTGCTLLDYISLYTLVQMVFLHQKYTYKEDCTMQHFSSWANPELVLFLYVSSVTVAVIQASLLFTNITWTSGTCYVTDSHEMKDWHIGYKTLRCCVCGLVASASMWTVTDISKLSRTIQIPQSSSAHYISESQTQKEPIWLCLHCLFSDNTSFALCPLCTNVGYLKCIFLSCTFGSTVMLSMDVSLFIILYYFNFVELCFFSWYDFLLRWSIISHFSCK